MKLRRSLVFVLLLIVTNARAGAQGASVATTAASAPGSEITVTLVTLGLGKEVFERFGHNALLFQDAITGERVAYNWGLFSFTQPGFLVRFLTGDTRYWMGADDPDTLIERALRAGRPVTLQRLNLSPAQATTLRDFVRWNARDENKFYRYDYFRDNCSTRLRDAIDGAVGGAIREAAASAHTSLTYRSESVRLTDGDKPAQAGIDIALGRPADVPITAWESFFIPMRMRDGIRNVRIRGADGTKVPLVAEERVVPLPPDVTPIIEAPATPRLAPRYAALGLLLAALVIGLRLTMVSRRSAAWGLALFGSAWSLLCGTLGVILLLAWTATKHVFWADNENLLLLTPIALVLAILIPAAVLRGRWERPTRMIAALVVMLGLVALVLSIVPGGQENRAIVALLLPVHIALAWAVALPRQVARQ